MKVLTKIEQQTFDLPGWFPCIVASITLSFHLSWLVTLWSLQLLILWGINVSKRVGCWSLRRHTISAGLQGYPTAAAALMISAHRNGFIQFTCLAAGLSLELYLCPLGSGCCKMCLEWRCGRDSSATLIDEGGNEVGVVISDVFSSVCSTTVSVLVAQNHWNAYWRGYDFNFNSSLLSSLLTLFLQVLHLLFVSNLPLISQCLLLKHIWVALFTLQVTMLLMGQPIFSRHLHEGDVCLLGLFGWLALCKHRCIGFNGRWLRVQPVDPGMVVSWISMSSITRGLIVFY